MHGSGAMAEAAIHQQLAQLRAELVGLKGESERAQAELRDRDVKVANKLDEVEAALAKRLTALETAYVASNVQEQRGKGLRHREAEKYMPDVWSGEKGAIPFSDFGYDVHNYLSVLSPDDEGGPSILNWAASRDDPITAADIEDLDLNNTYPHAKAINAAIGHLLTKVTKDTAKTMVKQAGHGNGLLAWQILARWYRPRSAMDKATSMTMVMNPGQCRDMGEMHRRLEEWEVSVREHEARFDDKVQESVRIAALLTMIPRAIYDQRFKGKAYDTYLDLRRELGNYLADRRPTIQVKQSGSDPNAMDIGELQEANPLMKLTQEIEALNAFVKGKGKGKKGEDHGPPSQSDYWGKGPGKKGDAKGQKGKGKGKGKRDLVCYNCGGRGHPARLCPTPAGMHEMGEEEPQQDAGPGGGETEEDQETEVQLCFLEDPKDYNSGGQGISTHNMFSLLDDSEEEVMCGMCGGPEEKGGWVKVTAVMDSGSAENALPEGLVDFIPTVPSPGSRTGKVYRGAGGEMIPNKGQKIMTVTTAEGQKRKSRWQVCPVTRPLMSAAKTAAAGNFVHLDENNPHIKNKRTGEITKLRKEGNVFALDFWVKRPAEHCARPGPVETSGFGRQG